MNSKNSINSSLRILNVLVLLSASLIFTLFLYQNASFSTSSFHNSPISFHLRNNSFGNASVGYLLDSPNLKSRLSAFIDHQMSQNRGPAEPSSKSLRALSLYEEAYQLEQAVDQTLSWISSLNVVESPLRYDRISNADAHILHKIRKYLRYFLKEASSSEDSMANLLNLAENGFQCSQTNKADQETISLTVKMDICSEIEWYKVIQLAEPNLSSFIDIGANKGYLGALFLSLWGGNDHQVNPLSLFELSKTMNLWSGSKNPAGYCKDGTNAGIPLYCPLKTVLKNDAVPSLQPNPTLTFDHRHTLSGSCLNTYRNISIHSIDGSSYLQKSVLSMLDQQMNPLSKSLGVWKYHHLAMSDGPGVARFTKQSAEKNAGFEGGKLKPMQDSDERTEVVRVDSVDNFVKELGLSSLDVLKIDAEGNDNKVLLGAANTISNWVKLLTFEGGGGVTFSQDMMDLYDSLGFSCYSTSRAGLFKWNGGCMVSRYFGNFRNKDKGNIFCVNRAKIPLVSLLFDSLSMPLLTLDHLMDRKLEDFLTNNVTSALGSQSRDFAALSSHFVNIRPFCQPWPLCVKN